MEHRLNSENPKKAKFFIIGSIFLGVFALFCIFVHLNLFNDIDYAVMTSLQRFLSPIADNFFGLLSITGSTEYTSLVLLVVGLIIWRRSKRIPLALVLFGVIFIVEIFGKFVIEHPKPPDYLQKHVFEIDFPSSSLVKTKYSYPSGHMGRSVFVSIIVAGAYIAKKKDKVNRIPIYLLTTCYIFIMSISRIYLGSHWLSDVLGGIYIGLSLSFFSLTFLAYDKHT